MTVKELIRELQNVPEDAIVLGDMWLNQECVIDTVEYDDATNTVSFYGNDIFEEPNVSDDVDETNENVYCGCDVFDYFSNIDRSGN